MIKTVVLYHGGGCADGFGAAYAAWRALGDDALYLPVNYGQTPLGEFTEADRLYILDFSYPRETLVQMARIVAEGEGEDRKVTVLDHHKTAREALEGLQADGLEVIFDMEKSGAVLTWEYFHPRAHIPKLIRYVQDRDLWSWSLPSSREISEWIKTNDWDFRTWDWMREQLETPYGFRHAVEAGSWLLKQKRQQVKSLARHSFFAEIEAGEETYWVPTVNAPDFLKSEVGEWLCEKHPDSPFAATFIVGETEEFWSLRSRGGFDVSKVAEANGGGGHAAAAGFKRRRS